MSPPDRAVRFGTARDLLRIGLVSALVLFAEMLLIRWIGTELRVFAYLQNAVLVAAFLGLGVGLRDAREPVRLLPAALALLAIALLVRDPFALGVGEAVTQGLSAFADSVLWQATWMPGAVGRYAYVRLPLVLFSLEVTLVVLAAVVFFLRPFGQWLGRWMDASPRPIAAYTANILGSLGGIAAFDLLTLAGTSPVVWLALLVTGTAAFLAAVDGEGARARTAAAVSLALVPVLAGVGEHGRVVWSPYQKLRVLGGGESRGSGRGEVPRCATEIEVNNAGYQLIVDLDARRMAATYPPGEVRLSHYVLPYELVGPRRRALVVGAGSGNDVAAALRAGVEQVRAVEIDPAIVALGRELNPSAPYASDRVQVEVDDARASFRREHGEYDLIWFGLLDAHTAASAYTNVRLDHFVYTRESFAEAAGLLAPAGVLVLYFEARTPWIADRLAVLLRDVFGTLPLVVKPPATAECLGWGGLLFVAGREESLAPIRARAAADPAIAGCVQDVQSWPLATVPTTDDWPYLYLETPRIPAYHLATAGACLLVLLAMRRRRLPVAGERSPGHDLPMLLLGAGFMLLEVSGVSRAALLFGTTWTVNAYVVGSILAMVLLANLVASALDAAPRRWPAAGLVVSLIALASLPPKHLAALPLAARVVGAGAFLALPVFFSGLVFVRAWAARAHRDLALGSNLIGALLGGIASLLSMAIGFRALALLTLAVYLAALLALERRGPAAPAEPGDAVPAT